MSDLFYRPIGFDDEGPNNGKFKNVLRRPTDLDSTSEKKPIDVNYNDPNEFLDYLYHNNGVNSNYARDIRSIQRYLEYKKNNSGTNFLFEESIGYNDINPVAIQNAVDTTNSSDMFTISDSIEMKPESARTVNYRISLRNSDSIKTDEMIEFITTFKREANRRKLYIGCKVLFDSSDAIVFYVDKNNLPGTIKLLEDLKDGRTYGEKVSKAINSFGHVQPFSATLYDESYYSIAMHGAEPVDPRIISTRGGGLINTFNEYIDYALEDIYRKLLTKYNNDASRILPEEIYNCLLKYHQARMKTDEPIPLWMNNRIYKELNEQSFGLKQ